MGPRRRALRLATGAQHQLLDQLVGRPRNLDDYRRYLAFNAAFRTAAERALSAGRPASFQPLTIAPDLLLDCRDLDVAPLPLPKAGFTGGRTEASRLGAVYVLEGAALGARVLLRDAEQIGLAETRGARHLAKLARPDGRWEAFLEVLEHAEVSDEREFTDSAREIFAYALSIAGSIAHAERV